MRLTRPPLSREQFREIAGRRRSADAVLLLREIERLKAVERLVREALAMPAGTRAGRAQRQQLIEALAGQLPPPHAFGLVSQRDAKEARRAELAADLGPMNYRDRAKVIAAQATPAPDLDTTERYR